MEIIEFLVNSMLPDPLTSPSTGVFKRTAQKHLLYRVEYVL